MDYLLIANIAILPVAVASIIILMVLLCKAEKKLAKYGERAGCTREREGTADDKQRYAPRP